MQHSICFAKVNKALGFKLVALTATFPSLLKHCLLKTYLIKLKSERKKAKNLCKGYYTFPPQNAKSYCYNGMNSLNKKAKKKIPRILRK